ncbi:MAG: hypothetical protein ACJ8FS_09210 [Sphingomicrobium sp.]
MKLRARVLAGLIAVASPALSQTAPAAAREQSLPAIILKVGSTFSIGRNNSGALDTKGGAAQPLRPYDLEFIRKLVTEHSDATGANGAIIDVSLPAPAIEKSHLRFSFVPIDDGRQTVLVIENGFPTSFGYRARIGRGSKSQVTDVCQLIPNKRGYEHWPYAIDWIEITDIHPVQWTGNLRCE